MPRLKCEPTKLRNLCGTGYLQSAYSGISPVPNIDGQRNQNENPILKPAKNLPPTSLKKKISREGGLRSFRHSATHTQTTITHNNKTTVFFQSIYQNQSSRCPPPSRSVEECSSTPFHDSAPASTAASVLKKMQSASPVSSGPLHDFQKRSSTESPVS
jgi:hypothetical protein